MNDDAKKKILARRASFVAAALAGVTACGKESAEAPQVCLSVPAMTLDAAAPPPQPCLSPVAVPRPDAGSEPPPDPSPPPDAGSVKALPPQPCLSVSPPSPAPQPKKP